MSSINQSKKYIAGIEFQVSCCKPELNVPNLIPQDLNERAGGRYIYPVKLWTYNPEEAIT